MKNDADGWLMLIPTVSSNYHPLSKSECVSKGRGGKAIRGKVGKDTRQEGS